MRNKRNVWITALCVFALLLGMCSVAFAAEPADAFLYTEGKDGLTLTGYTGSASNLTIPAEIGGKAVTAIGDECFQGLVCLKRVHVPEGVKTIGDYAFEACSALQRIYLPASLTAIGDGAFSGCGHLTLADMQDNVARIGKGAFLCCDALVNL
ncbi:MAG: leucine-rich repeat domain-containing protein, partial [Ruminococcus sp.]|nr:leucine-rich repeat domain-containing protein [Ruminococcus sp.]